MRHWPINHFGSARALKLRRFPNVINNEVIMKKIIPIIALLGVLGCVSQANAGVRVGIGVGVPVPGFYAGPYPYGDYYYGDPYYYAGPTVYFGPGYYPWYHGYWHGGYVHHWHR
jgi:hypothetical protein